MATARRTARAAATKSKNADVTPPAEGADDLVTEPGDGGDTPGISLSHEDFENNPGVIDMAKVVDPDLGGRDDGQAGDDEPAARKPRSSRQRAADAEADAETDSDAGDPETTADAADRVVPTVSPDVPSIPLSVPDAEPVKGRGPVRLRLVGTKSGGPRSRPPYGVTVIVPSGDGDYDGSHTEGETVHFVRGRATRVSGHAASWLEGHPEYIVERV